MKVGEGQADCEYVVVGSGAGGGTVAARLAEAGKRVVLLEAGGDPRLLSGGDSLAPDENRLPDDYDVPAFHAFASENTALSWDFFVRHYGDDARQRRDPKYRAEWNGRAVDGVLYPRAGTLGGCTAHNALILTYPQNEDWDAIATLTGDPSWSAARMRGYFERLENCHHRPLWRWLGKLGINPSRHGWRGWLHTESKIPAAAFGDVKLREFICDSALAAFEDCGSSRERWPILLAGGDPNDWRWIKQDAEGVCYTPLVTRGHRRVGARERVLEAASKYPDRLRLELDALATKVLFDERKRAIGIEYLKGARLYRAFARPSGAPGERRQILASQEVILSGGTFNTPQLLMLSGVGARAALEGHRIPLAIDLPGVGKNLQDRYEVAVVNRMKFDHWPILAGARFDSGDPLYREWQRRPRAGVYATNGVSLAAIKRSSAGRTIPDLFCMAFLGKFQGYFPGYARLLAEHHNYLTWCILKAHTQNRAGEVTLRSTDPRDPPNVNFRYFEEGNDCEGEDLESVTRGIRFVRALARPLKERGLIAEEELPGGHVQSSDDLRDYVRNNAWGHHASCSCAIGPRDAGGVLTSDFRVHGTQGLRVVDASVFPRIPGYFIAAAIYMIAEKAADVILQDAASAGR